MAVAGFSSAGDFLNPAPPIGSTRRNIAVLLHSGFQSPGAYKNSGPIASKPGQFSKTRPAGFFEPRLHLHVNPFLNVHWVDSLLPSTLFTRKTK
jgi:hypothetical protein